MEYTIVRDEDYLEHHGIKGQKWGVRRFQNEDGTLTEEGKKRYGDDSTPYTKKQYDRDVSVYGKKAAKRINDATLHGSSVSGARSEESSRIVDARIVARRLGKMGVAGGGIVGTYVGSAVFEKLATAGKMAGEQLLKKNGNDNVALFLAGMDPSVASAVGAFVGARIGAGAGADIGVSVGMQSKGFERKQYRKGYGFYS